MPGVPRVPDERELGDAGAKAAGCCAPGGIISARAGISGSGGNTQGAGGAMGSGKDKGVEAVELRLGVAGDSWLLLRRRKRDLRPADRAVVADWDRERRCRLPVLLLGVVVVQWEWEWEWLELELELERELVGSMA